MFIRVHPWFNFFTAGFSLSLPPLSSFPYMADPTAGYDTVHSAAGSITPPPAVPELGSLLMFGTGLAGLGSYALRRARRGG